MAQPLQSEPMTTIQFFRTRQIAWPSVDFWDVSTASSDWKNDETSASTFVQTTMTRLTQVWGYKLLQPRRHFPGRIKLCQRDAQNFGWSELALFLTHAQACTYTLWPVFYQHTHSLSFSGEFWKRGRQRICWSVAPFILINVKSFFLHTRMRTHTRLFSRSFFLSHTSTHTLSLIHLPAYSLSHEYIALELWRRPFLISPY